MADLKHSDDLSRFLNRAALRSWAYRTTLPAIGGQALRLLTISTFRKNLPGQSKYADVKGLACYPDLKSVPQPAMSR